MEKNTVAGEMKTLSSCINRLVSDGYTESFKVTEKGLFSLEKEKYYKPEDVHIVNFCRFEGASDPADSSILYVVELDDKTKGTLTDAYGSYADPQIEKFVRQVEDISKKTTDKN